MFWRRWQDHEESVEEFVRRNLGDEVFERLIEPFCSGANQFLMFLAYHVSCCILLWIIKLYTYTYT